MPDLIDVVLRLDSDLADFKRRFENGDRPGTVHEVDPKKQRVRLRIGGTEAEPFLSPWVPYAQVAGAFKFHSPPSEGQQMLFRCPGGDFRQGCAIPFTFSNENPSPSDKGDEHVATFGETRHTVREKQIRQEVADAIHEVLDSKIQSVLGSAVHEVLSGRIQSKVGGSLLKVARAALKAAATRIDLN